MPDSMQQPPFAVHDLNDAKMRLSVCSVPISHKFTYITLQSNIASTTSISAVRTWRQTPRRSENASSDWRLFPAGSVRGTLSENDLVSVSALRFWANCVSNKLLGRVELSDDAVGRRKKTASNRAWVTLLADCAVPSSSVLLLLLKCYGIQTIAVPDICLSQSTIPETQVTDARGDCQLPLP